VNKTSIGKKGEELAKEYFKKKKYTIVDHNFRCRLGEIDLILRKGTALRFVEVKLRRTLEFGLPQESVIKYKQQRIRNTALLWLKRRYLPTDSEIHFDVLAISEESGKFEYEHIEDAF
jgi:putative endonuclease